MQEVEDAMRSHRWSIIRRLRNDYAYIYAARKVAGKRKERYIAPLNSLEALTVESLLAKLTGIEVLPIETYQNGVHAESR